MKKYLLIIITIVISISCSNEQSKNEAQKILDKQAKLIDKQQEDIDDIYNEMVTVKDSLQKEELKLITKKKQIIEESNELDIRKKVFDTEETSTKIKKLKTNKVILTKQYNKLTDSIALIKKQVESLQKIQDSLNIIGLSLSVKKNNTKELLKQVDKEIKLFKKPELTIIHEEKSVFDKNKTNPITKEVTFIKKQNSQKIKTPNQKDSLNSNLLNNLDNSIKKKREVNTFLKKEIAFEKQKIVEQKAVIKKKKATKIRTVKNTFATIALIIVIAILTLFFIGRNNRQKKE